MAGEDLAALLSSRICHDLVSPVGAVANGIDLIREIGGSNCADEIAMIGQSAERATALLEYYRLAFGAAEEGTDDIARSRLRAQAIRLLASPRIEIDWPEAAGPALPRCQARLLYQLLLCARAILGMAGRLSVRLPAQATLPLSVGAAGANGLNGDLVQMLACPEAARAVAARQIEFRLAPQAAAALGLTLRVERAADRVEIVAGAD